MLFPSTTIGDLQIRLLLIRPELNVDKGRTIEVTHRFDTIIGEGRTTIEERRAGRAALLLAQRCTLPLEGNTADDWRKGIMALGPRPIGVPLWIDALPALRWKHERIYDAQKVVAFNPITGAFTIADGATVAALSDGAIVAAYPAPQLIAPLMIGHWNERPAAEVLTPAFGQVEVMITEASPWACRIGINSYGASWAAVPDWAAPLRDQSDYGLERVQLGGAVRESATDRDNAAPRWRQEGAFVFKSRLEIRQALTWFVARKGATESWSPVPAWFQPGADTPDTPDDYTARFASDSLALTYQSGKVARSNIGFLQEIDTGERSQSLASETYLYTFAYHHDTGNPERYTNWDQPIVGAEGTFEPKQCAHRELHLSLRPQDMKADLSVARIAGSLMADWIIGRLFGPVRLTVEQVDPADVAATRTVIFDGYVRNVLPDGNTLQLTATLFGRMLDKRVPADEFGPRCAASVFDSRCGLVEADHDSAGTIAPADVSADGFTVTVHSVSGWGDGGTGTYDENWFGPNGIFRTGTGRSKMTATIVSSEMDGADLVIKLKRPIFADMLAGGGQAATLIPGCGGQRATDCVTKFNNLENYRGFDFMPDYIEQSAPGAAPKAKK